MTDVVFFGLKKVMPLMTEGLLQFPTLASRYFSLVSTCGCACMLARVGEGDTRRDGGDREREKERASETEREGESERERSGVSCRETKLFTFAHESSLFACFGRVVLSDLVVSGPSAGTRPPPRTSKRQGVVLLSAVSVCHLQYRTLLVTPRRWGSWCRPMRTSWRAWSWTSSSRSSTRSSSGART